MTPPEECPRSDHRAPAGGGSCACGMVTRVPAVVSPREKDVRHLLARCLDDGPAGSSGQDTWDAVGSTPSLVVQERVDRVLAALADAGLVVTPDADLRRPA